MRNKFAVGAVGQRVSIVEGVPERLTIADALNLAAHLAAAALAAKGGDTAASLESFLSDVAEAAEGSEIADRIRAELKS